MAPRTPRPIAPLGDVCVDDFRDERGDRSAHAVIAFNRSRKGTRSPYDVVGSRGFLDHRDATETIEKARCTRDSAGKGSGCAAKTSGEALADPFQKTNELRRRHRFVELGNASRQHGRVSARERFLGLRRQRVEVSGLASALWSADAFLANGPSVLERCEMEPN